MWRDCRVFHHLDLPRPPLPHRQIQPCDFQTHPGSRPDHARKVSQCVAVVAAFSSYPNQRVPHTSRFVHCRCNLLHVVRRPLLKYPVRMCVCLRRAMPLPRVAAPARILKTCLLMRRCNRCMCHCANIQPLPPLPAPVAPQVGLRPPPRHRHGEGGRGSTGRPGRGAAFRNDPCAAALDNRNTSLPSTPPSRDPPAKPRNTFQPAGSFALAE